jgi:Zn-dependent protease with chaperone function
VIVAGVLLLYVAIATVVGGRVLARADWPGQAPVLGIWAWQVLTWSVAGALVMAVLVLAMPVMPFNAAVADVLAACSMSLVSHYTTPGGSVVAWSALVAGGALAARPLWFFVAELADGVRVRRRQRQALKLVGWIDPAGVTTLEHDLPMVYCVPGRHAAIVVTSGARDRLSDRQLELVIGHEVAHLRARHHWALAGARALRRSFAPLPLFADAESAIAALIEMQADDSASCESGRRELARALLALSPQATRPPLGALGSAGDHSLVRARRLSRPRSRMHPRRVALAYLVGAVVLALPVLLALGPGFESAVRDCCHAAI